MQRDFSAAGYESELIRSINDTTEIYWQPDWQHVFDKSNSNGSVYTYISLKPIIRSKVSSRSAPATELGSRRFLISRVKEGETIFSLAIYTRKQPANKDGFKKRLEVLTSFNAFSGEAHIRELSKSSAYTINYLSGNTVSDESAINNKKSILAGKSQSSYCRTIYRCEYCAYCGTVAFYNAQVATVISENGCGEGPGYEPCDNWGHQWNLLGSSAYTECYGGDYPPLPDPGGGGGGGTPDENASIEGNADYLLANPLALFGPCPGLSDKWGKQINFVPPPQVLQKLSNLGPRTGINFGGIPVNWVYYVQSIGNASGALLNLDNHSIFMSSLPVINGQQTDVISFGNYIRLHLSELTGANFTPAPNTGFNEAYNWVNSPVGTVLQIDIPFDPGSVICSDYTVRYTNGEPYELSWTFTTIHDPYMGDHPVSGTRTFSLHKEGSGYVFYTQGADRLTGLADVTVSLLSEMMGNSMGGIQFTRGDDLWISTMYYIREFLSNKGISSVDRSHIMNRPKYVEVRDALLNGKSLSTIPCN